MAAYSEATSLGGEPCAQLNVMLTAQPFWRNGKPIDVSRFSRFGLTLQLLTVDSGEDLLTWFREDFLARISPSQAAEPASTASVADSGEKWSASFARWNRDTHGWKTAQRSLLEDSDEFSETWPTSGSMRSGECWERPTLELTTSESGSGYLPTPTASSYGTTNNGRRGDGSTYKTAGKPSLETMARHSLWPTPTATLGSKGGRVTPRKSREGGTLIEAVSARTWPTPTVKGNYNRKGLSSRSGDGLPTAVLKCPTPTASDWKGSARPGQRRGQLTDPKMNVIPAGGQLNPTWVEWLMGWPIGWTALQPLAMDKFQEWKQQHGGCSTDENNADTSLTESTKVNERPEGCEA